MNGLVWRMENSNGTSRRDWLDEKDTNDAINKLEAAAGWRGEWETNDFGGQDWWGVTGTFNGAVFTLYTHKSGTIKIGGFEDLDVVGLKAALQEVIR